MGFVELVFRREGRFLRWCARKRLHEQFRNDPAFRSMFMDEARLAGLVRHPNAVGVLDVGEDEEGPFLIMDFVEGVPLSRLIAQAAAARRSVPMQVAVRICLDAAQGLHAAHEVRAEDGTILHLVHRDVSPQNVLIGFDGTVRVTDFGIAKALGNTSRTSAGVLKGNMGYLSPEQLRFEEPDRRSDFFSLGVSLYELLSGLRLYPNKTGFDGTRRILTEPPPDIGEVRSDVPPELCELLFEMLAKDRGSRPPTAVDIAARLEGVLAALIAEEGSVTVGDYMSQHFKAEREEQRTVLAAHMKRVEAEGAPALRSVPTPSQPIAVSAASGPDPVARTGRARTRAVVALAAAAAMAAVVMVVVRPRLQLEAPPRATAAGAVVPAPASSSAAVSPTGAPAGGVEAAASRARPIAIPAFAVTAAASSVPEPMAAAPVARAPVRSGVRGSRAAASAAEHHRSTKRLAHRARAAEGNAPRVSKEAPAVRDPSRLAVPLFERWQ